MPTGDTAARPAVPTVHEPDQADADHTMDIDQSQPTKVTRAADPSRVTVYRAFAPVASFPKGSVSEHCLAEACSYLVGAKPKFTKGNPKMVVIETTSQETHTALITTGLKAKGAHTKFLDYSPKWKNAELGLVEIAVSGLPRGCNVDTVAAQLTAHLGKSVEESSCGSFKHRGVYRSTAFFMLKDCEEITKLIQVGRIEVNGIHLTVRSTEQMHDYEEEKGATMGLCSLKPGMNDESVYRALMKYGVEGVKTVQVRRRGLQQRPIRAAVVIFKTKDDMEAATSILFGAGPLNQAVWAPVSGKACDACGVDGHRVLECTKVHYRPRKPMADATMGHNRKAFGPQVQNGVTWSSVVTGTKAGKPVSQDDSFDNEIRSMERMCMGVAIVTGTPRELARERFQAWEKEEREKKGGPRHKSKEPTEGVARNEKSGDREDGEIAEKTTGKVKNSSEGDAEMAKVRDDFAMEEAIEVTAKGADETDANDLMARMANMERELRACQQQMAEKDKVITELKESYKDKHAELCELVAEARTERDEWRARAEIIEHPTADTTHTYDEPDDRFDPKAPLMTMSDDDERNTHTPTTFPMMSTVRNPKPMGATSPVRTNPAKRGTDKADITIERFDVQHEPQRPRHGVTTRSQTKIPGASTSNPVRQNTASTPSIARRA